MLKIGMIDLTLAPVGTTHYIYSEKSLYTEKELFFKIVDDKAYYPDYDGGFTEITHPSVFMEPHETLLSFETIKQVKSDRDRELQHSLMCLKMKEEMMKEAARIYEEALVKHNELTKGV